MRVMQFILSATGRGGRPAHSDAAHVPVGPEGIVEVDVRTRSKGLLDRDLRRISEHEETASREAVVTDLYKAQLTQGASAHRASCLALSIVDYHSLWLVAAYAVLLNTRACWLH